MNKISIDKLSNQEEIYPCVIEDIEYWFLMEKDNVRIYSIGNKKVDRYIKISEKNLALVLDVIKEFDGKHEIREISKKIQETHKAYVDINEIYSKFNRAGLLKNSDLGFEKSEIRALALNIFNIDIPLLGESARKNISRLWYSYTAMCLLIIGIGLFLLITCAGTVVFSNQAVILNNSYIKGVAITFLMAVPCLLMHEMSHAICAISMGLMPSKIALSLYFGILPMWYVKIPGIYTIKPSKRVWVLASGVFTNFVIALASVIAVVLFDLNGESREIVLKLATANFFSVIFSLNPFTLSDGYFIFTTILKIPNLRFNMIKKVANLSNKGFTLNYYEALYIITGILILGASVSSTYWWAFHVLYEIFGHMVNVPFNYYMAFTVLVSVTFVMVCIVIKRAKAYLVRV